MLWGWADRTEWLGGSRNDYRDIVHHLCRALGRAWDQRFLQGKGIPTGGRDSYRGKGFLQGKEIPIGVKDSCRGKGFLQG